MMNYEFVSLHFVLRVQLISLAKRIRRTRDEKKKKSKEEEKTIFA